MLLSGLVFAAGAAESVQAQEEQFNQSLHRRISTLTHGQPPEMVDGHVLLTYDGQPSGGRRARNANGPAGTGTTAAGPTATAAGTDRRPAVSRARYVAVAFAHEQFARLHPYRIVRSTVQDPENPNETMDTRVFALAYSPPEDLERLEYRIVVDGLWQTDPMNPNTVLDANGVPRSVFELPDRPQTALGVPRVFEDGRVEFIFEPGAGDTVETIRDVMIDLGTNEGLRVSVAGSFNNWDPFMHRLRETEPGVYRLTLRVPPGRHHYYLVVDGRRILDPENDTRTRHRGGFRVCSFTVP